MSEETTDTTERSHPFVKTLLATLATGIILFAGCTAPQAAVADPTP